MGYYEMLCILSPSLSDEEREELIGRFNEFIESKGGRVVSENRWGKRSLAYPIQKSDSGYYVLSYVEIPMSSVEDVKHFTKINENFFRIMVIRKEHPVIQEKSTEEVGSNVNGSK